MTYHTDPFPFLQCADDVGANRYTPHSLDFPARNGLPVGNQGDGFKQGT